LNLTVKMQNKFSEIGFKYSYSLYGARKPSPLFFQKSISEIKDLKFFSLFDRWITSMYCSGILLLIFSCQLDFSLLCKQEFFSSLANRFSPNQNPLVSANNQFINLITKARNNKSNNFLRLTLCDMHFVESLIDPN